MLDVVYYPDPILRRVSTEITQIDAELESLVEQMFETMYGNIGIGLAAPQIGKNIRLVVIDIRDPHKETSESTKLVLINPVITFKSKEKEKMEEGCLSLPDISANVVRPARVRVKALGLDGEEFELEAEGLLARCVQHEIDHLDGIVFTDKVSLASKLSVKGGLRRLEEDYMDRMSKKEAE